MATNSESSFLFGARTLWLFTFSDLKTTLLPSVAYRTSNALFAHMYGLPDCAGLRVLSRILLVVIWVWLNLLSFNIDN